MAKRIGYFATSDQHRFFSTSRAEMKKKDFFFRDSRSSAARGCRRNQFPRNPRRAKRSQIFRDGDLKWRRRRSVPPKKRRGDLEIDET